MKPDPPRFEFVLIGDSEDTRTFIELSSYAVDLVEARDALELTLRSLADPDSPLREAERSLVAAAVMAYCRTFFSSKVRGPLTRAVEVPPALVATHELVAAFRNRTIAHSQSDLSVTYAVGVLDAETLVVRDVMAPTISSTLPPEHVQAFLTLVTTMVELLDEAIEPVRQRLVQTLQCEDLAALVRAGIAPARELLAADFRAATTRPPYPTSHPTYWSVEVDD